MNQFIHSLQNILFDIALFIWYILLGLTYFNAFQSAPYYLDLLNAIIKIYISLFLMWRFNDLRNVQFTRLDKKIVFNAAVYLFMSTVLMQFIIKKMIIIDDRVKEFTKKNVHIV
jgi:hypothetical protein